MLKWKAISKPKYCKVRTAASYEREGKLRVRERSHIT